ncbi:methyltransferase [Galdieria sulphuraria]|uniref:Alpha N-terminal protein methyltransferase 1 n=1 Tax=Galdieria sulphuraria TaxID=130081 RepID=M2Y6E4_GALSU|nr:methyltransferase [Galdieria sulphuraria]EME31603.1 methyltransferase [Galdieria sulphuraria]|eukprot:XP_005708123.1 methyltransferase [Galdieria sulphuraria]
MWLPVDLSFSLCHSTRNYSFATPREDSIVERRRVRQHKRQTTFQATIFIANIKVHSCHPANHNKLYVSELASFVVMSRQNRKRKSKRVGKATYNNAIGYDTRGRLYQSVEEVWYSHASRKQEDWYSIAESYWHKQNPSVDGMLGGYSNLSDIDVRSSLQFLQGLQLPSTRIALDVGSGIGRVATELLTKMFEQVDLLEPNVHFLELAKQNVSDSQLGRVFRCSMQDFIPEVDRKYDLIWIQWCIIYLTDEDLVEFLKRCKSCLSASGLICIKDNVSRKHFVVDTNDASITRTSKQYEDLFKQAGLHLVCCQIQENFPRQLFPVFMYALGLKSF